MFIKLTFFRVKKPHTCACWTFFSPNVPCHVEENTVLDTMKHKVSIYLWPKLHRIVWKTQNKQSSLDETSVLLLGCAFCLGGLVWLSYSAVCKLTAGFFWKDGDDEETLPMAPLQECPCPVLSVTLTAKEHVSYSIFWSSHTPEVPLSWMCRSAPKETVGLGKVSGTVKQPGTVSWTGRGRREKMMT